MRYTVPKVLNTLNATDGIQSIDQDLCVSKWPDYFYDAHYPNPCPCTAAAYEADE
jgi:hypothetical protein